MKKLLKILGILLAALLLLILALALVLPFIIDPNDYKDEITAAVRDATGRELTIAGEMELSVFPWLGLEINDVSLSNAAGFGPEPFARLQQADVRVRLLPLLAGEVEIGKVVIAGLQLNLARNAEGASNWDDLLRPGAAAPAAAEPAAQPGPDLEKLRIGGLELRGARLVFTDAMASRRFTVAPLNLELGAFEPGVPLPLHLDADLAMTNPALQLQLVLDTTLEFDLQRQAYAAADGRLSLSAAGAPVPLERAELEAAWQRLAADLAQDTARIEALELRAHGAEIRLAAELRQLSGEPAGSLDWELPAFTPDAAVMAWLDARLPEAADPALLAPFAASGGLRFDLAAGSAGLQGVALRAGPVELGLEAEVAGLTSDAPQVAGKLVLNELNPLRLLVALGQEAPPTANPDALSRFALQTGFAATPNALSLEPLALELDQTRVSGRLAVTDLAARALAFDLAVDGINLDGYLPPAAEQAPQAAQGGALDEVELPVEPVRDLNLEGRLTIGELQAFGLKSSDIEIGLRAAQGRVRVHPARANLYGGSYTGDIRYDVSGAVPRIALDEHLAGVRIGALLTDMFEFSRFSGTARVDVTLEAAGRTVGDLRRGLNGTAAAALENGALEGASLWDAIMGAYAQLQGQQAPPAGEQRTPITEMSLSARIKDGVATNDDLKARVPFLAVTGAGTVDLVRETLDYRLRAKVLGTPQAHGLQGLERLEGLTVPVRIQGGFADFSIRPDLGEALKARARAEAEAAKEEARREAERRLEQRKEEAKKKLGDKLKDIFDRL